MKKLIIFIVCMLVISGCGSQESPEIIETPTPIAKQTATITAPDNPQTGAIFELVQAGFAVQRSCQKTNPCLAAGESFPDGSMLLFYPANGGAPAEIYIPTYGDVLHIASPVDFDHPEDAVFLFQDYVNEQLLLTSNGEEILRFDNSNTGFITGADGQRVFAFTYLPGTTNSGLSEIAVHPGVGAMATASGPEWLLIPVQIEGNRQPPPDNAYVSLWYTNQPYGIGGEIVFPYYRGLYHLVGNGEIHEELLAQDLQFSAISPNSNLIAFTQPPQGAITIRNLEETNDVTIPLLPDSEKGAGYAVFSPDSSQLAWMEASGSIYAGDFESAIRIATSEGEILAEFPAADLQQAAGYSNVTIRPVGWIDNQRVLLQVNVPRDSGEPILLVVTTDGEIESEIIQGTYIGSIFSSE